MKIQEIRQIFLNVNILNLKPALFFSSPKLEEKLKPSRKTISLFFLSIPDSAIQMTKIKGSKTKQKSQRALNKKKEQTFTHT
jgi:hypothetical protein